MSYFELFQFPSEKIPILTDQYRKNSFLFNSRRRCASRFCNEDNLKLKAYS